MSSTDAHRVRRTQRERVAKSSEDLLHAAIDLIAEQGFERTTATQIGERAGLSRQMVRLRYGSKEALLESLLRTDYTDRMLPDRTSESGVGVILDWIRRIREQARDEPRLTRAYFVLFFEAAGPIPALQPWTKGWFAQCEAITAEALRTSQHDGTIRADLDTTAEAIQFVAAGVGLAYRWVIDSDGESYDNAMLGLSDRFESYRR